MLDTLDDFFWMLPFSSKKQAQIIQHENDVTNEVWQTRRDKIAAEHRIPIAKEQLAQLWKVWIAQDAFKARREAATHAVVALP